MLRKIFGYSTFVISVVLSLILSVTVLAVATTTEIGQVGHFMVSLNGRQILFVSETSSASDHSWASVMLFDFSTSDVIGLTGKVIEVALSPDEKTIVYVEKDSYYGISLSLLTSDGRRLKTHYYQKMGSFSQLRWSKNSKYLTFVYDGRPLFGKRTVVISPEKMGVVPDELANVEWQEPKKLQADHLLYQKKPTVRADSIVLWGDNKTIYVQAVDGIWKGSLDEPFIVRWEKLVAAEDITGPQAISISTTGTHLLYSTKKRAEDFRFNYWILPLKAGTNPVNVGEGVMAQFTPDGQGILLVGVGLWIVSLDGSSRRRLTSQQSLP